MSSVQINWNGENFIFDQQLTVNKRVVELEITNIAAKLRETGGRKATGLELLHAS